jgi:hypothetical protein
VSANGAQIEAQAAAVKGTGELVIAAKSTLVKPAGRLDALVSEKPIRVYEKPIRVYRRY